MRLETEFLTLGPGGPFRYVLLAVLGCMVFSGGPVWAGEFSSDAEPPSQELPGQTAFVSAEKTEDGIRLRAEQADLPAILDELSRVLGVTIEHQADESPETTLSLNIERPDISSLLEALTQQLSGGGYAVETTADNEQRIFILTRPGLPGIAPATQASTTTDLEPGPQASKEEPANSGKPKRTSSQNQTPLPNGGRTDVWAVQVVPGTSVEALAQRLGAENLGPIASLEGFYALRMPLTEDLAQAEQMEAALALEPEVEWYEQQILQQMQLKTLPADPTFPSQWHLNNTGQSNGTAGEDINVIPAWNSGADGTGVVISIVDDGLEHTHPDINPNYLPSASYDYNNDDTNPIPLGHDPHGTAVGGLAAGRDDGSSCGVGVAYRAALAGIRLIAYPTTDQQQASALSYGSQISDISNNSWGPTDEGILRPVGTLTRNAMAARVNDGRGGLGTIYAWAGGNGKGSGDNVNYDGWANSRYTIAVGASDHHGVQSSYSEPGAALLVNAPSSGSSHGNISTDDLTGYDGWGGIDCRSNFSGTSASTPMVSGVVALALDVNPNLNWREVQHLLVQSAEKNDPDDSDWVQNGADHDVNHKYGFGRVDAYAAVEAARNWPSTVDETSQSSGVNTVNQAIPDNDANGVSDTISFPTDLIIEHVEIVFNASHPFRGDLEVFLTSPDGTRSVLAESRPDSGDNYSNWRFMSTRHWGESSAGSWTLQVADRGALDLGTFNNWELVVYGTRSQTGTADVSITQSDPADPVAISSTHTYTISVSNAGPAAASELVVRDTLPAGTTFTSANGAGWNCAHLDGVVTCTRPSLGIGSAPDITVSVTTPASLGTIYNVARVKAAQVDHNINNNFHAEPASVTRTADLSVDVLESSDPVPEGSIFNYTVVVTNSGPDYAGDIRIQATLAAELGFVSANGGGWVCTYSNPVVTCTRPSLSIQTAPPVTLTVSAPASTGEVISTIAVSASTAEPTLADNSRVETTAIEPPLIRFVETQVDEDGALDVITDVDSVAVSPAGDNVYVGSSGEDTLLTFSRNSLSGELTLSEVYVDGVDGVEALIGVRSVLVSPDGRYVYTAASREGIGIFSRDQTTGALTYQQTVQDNVGGVDGLFGVRSLRTNSDGTYLYAASEYDDAVAVFTRDSSTGAITFVEFHRDGQSGVDGLNGAYSLVVSPDDRHLYAVGAWDDAVVAFSRNAVDGTLTFIEFHRDGFNGVDSLDGAVSISVSADGKHVYVAGANDNSLAVFDRDAISGALTFSKRVIEAPYLFGVRSVVVSSDDAYVYAVATNYSLISVFTRDAVSGDLTLLEFHEDGVNGVAGLSSVLSLAISPDENHVYSVSTRDDAVSAFTRDASTGRLTYRSTIADGDGGVEGLSGITAVEVSPDGKHVYGVGDSDHAIFAFGRDSSDGTLEFLESHQSGVAGVAGIIHPMGVAIAPDGKNVYGTSRTGSAVAVFGRNSTSGALTFLEHHSNSDAGVDGLATASSVTVSPDGKNVYVTGQHDDAISMFSRSFANGTLSQLEVHKDNTSGIDGLDGATHAVVAPDGRHVYVVGRDDDSIVTFSRDKQTGSLLFLENLRDSVGGVDGLDGAISVDISSDGMHVYVASWYESSIAVFGRDSATGRLSFIEQHRDGVVGVDGLESANSIKVSPDGAFVFVAGFGEHAMAVFRRNPATGRLTFAEVRKNGVAGFDGLHSADWLTLSPDGAHIYSASRHRSKLGVFELQPKVPRVTRISSASVTEDFQLTEGEATTQAITQLLVTFGMPVQDPAGNSGADDVTNPDNYRLLRDGANDSFETSECGAVQGDDINVAAGPVSYDSDARTATVTVNGGSALPADAYRLLVCGSTSIMDADGDALDGNADGTGGDDFVRNFTISSDVDGDGRPDFLDNCPATSNPGQENFDGDSRGDACDPDDDNDGTNDGVDAFPFDPSESLDTDGDGTGNNADIDDDNDGAPDRSVPDLVFALGGSTRLHTNLGGGSFSSGTGLGPSNPLSRDVAIADLDGDGDLDVFQGNWFKENKVYFNDGFGAFTTGENVTGDIHYTFSVAAGDVDGDGDIDLVAGNNHTHRDRLYRNNGSGGFSAGEDIGTDERATRSVALADMDGDNDLDYITDQKFLYLNDGLGNFAPAVLWTSDTQWINQLAVGDLDGDGDLDVVTAVANSSNRRYLNNGDGTFGTAATFGYNVSTQSVALADIDGDGDQDVVTADQPGRIRAYLNDGFGGFSTQHWLSPLTIDHHNIALADVDLDGDVDLVSATEVQDKLYLNNGDGTFATSSNISSTSERSYAVAFAVLRSTLDAFPLNATEQRDPDGDGMPDSFENANGLNPLDASDGTEDPDSDGLNNVGEFQAGTDPNNADTDGDGVTDSVEVAQNRDPNVDELSILEIILNVIIGHDPFPGSSLDIDRDGIPDSFENANGLNPLDASDALGDLDGDGLNNLGEFQAGTDPGNPDTDGDGTRDSDEVAQNRNPKVNESGIINSILNSILDR